MECERWREALSARIDGEELGVGEDLLEAHLGGCAACRAHAIGLEQLHRGLRLRPADDVPDLSEQILAAATAERRWPRLGLSLVLRWVLVLLAAMEIALASPELLGRWHTGSELGTWSVAIGVGFLSVAARPARAGALVPMLAAAGVLTAFVTSRHLVDGATSPSAEWPHGLVLCGVIVVMAIWRLEETSQRPDPRPVDSVGSDGKPMQERRAA